MSRSAKNYEERRTSFHSLGSAGVKGSSTLAFALGTPRDHGKQSGESLAVDHIEQFRCTARSPPCRICLLDDILVAYFAGSEIRWYDGSRLCRIGIYNGRLGLGGAKQISSATNTVWHTLLLVDLSERELATFSIASQLSEQSI